MAAGKIQFYHEIMNTTIMDGFRDYFEALAKRAGGKLYIEKGSGKGLYLGTEMEKGAGMGCRSL